MHATKILRGKNFLWVEDDYHSLKALMWKIEKLGGSIRFAESVTDAKEVLATQRDFSVIVLDLILPINNQEPWEPEVDPPTGFETMIDNGVMLFGFVRKEVGLEVPIILLTVVEKSDIIGKLLKQGRTRALLKSTITPDVLLKTVTALLDIKEVPEV
jgi:CheY-like chemotaxis protein